MHGYDVSTAKEFSHTEQKTLPGDIDETIPTLISNATENLLALQISTQPLLSENQKKEIQVQLDKIKSLNLIIPIKGHDQVYYSIADSVAGVTKKTCLISQIALKNSLIALTEVKDFAAVENNKIRMNAILKHPKSGKDTEVQREAIGLKIARILGFSDVTESTLVNHNTGTGRHPCLLVPFGQMELLTFSMDHVDGMEGRLKKEHFQSTEDLGKYSAFFMICSDPDFIGKAGQNKGLTGDELKRLYLFDQVFMTDNNLGLDRLFNLVPTNLFVKMPDFISRHFMGRNKSVINDSLYEEKIQGAIAILQKKGEIQKMFEGVKRANPRAVDDPLVKALQKDAAECLNAFNDRIGILEKLFPTVEVNGEAKQVGDLVRAEDTANLELLKKAMMANQLLNKPRLFDESGKPYRAPFLAKLSTFVKGVSIAEDNVTISFSRELDFPLFENKKTLLEQQGFTISEDGKSATIPKTVLQNLSEQNYFKERSNSIDLGHAYIDNNKINTLAQTYKENVNDGSVDSVKRLVF